MVEETTDAVDRARRASFTAGTDPRFESGVALDAIAFVSMMQDTCDTMVAWSRLFPISFVYALIVIFRLAGFDLGVI